MDQQGHLVLPHTLPVLFTEAVRLALKQHALNAHSFAYKFSFCSLV